MSANMFFDWKEIVVRGSERGTRKTTCPVCSPERKKKNDTCLYVNFESGVAKCFHCSALSFRDSEEKLQAKKDFTLPPQTWRNFTTLSDKLVKWCFEARRLSQTTLQYFHLTEEEIYQPAASKVLNSICFNYFEGETVVNKKYRTAKKDFTQSKGGKPIMYNINSIIGADTVYIVEGEFDVLAMYEHGVKECVSLPNGANDHDDYWINSEPYMKDAKKFVIATDNDEKGIIVRDKIAQRLGRYRCTYIEWDGKDANDDLKSGKITQSLASEKRFPVSGVFTIAELHDDITKLYNSGLPETMYPKKPAFGEFGKMFSVMPGQLTVGTGIPSHGKSTFTEWLVLNLIDEYELKASFFSPEHSPLALHQANFIQKAVGKPFFGNVEGVSRVDQSDIDRYVKWANERLYITSGGAGETVCWDWILNTFKEQLFMFGINIFVVDAWNKVEMPKGYTGKDGIDRTLTRLTSFCQQHNVQIFLIAHPTKMKKDMMGVYEMPTLYDVSGSADFRNQAHNGFAIHRYFADETTEGHTAFVNLKTKFDFQGKITGSIKFNYHQASGRYYADGCSPYMFDLTEKGEKPDIDIFDTITPPTITPNKDFDNVPF